MTLLSSCSPFYVGQHTFPLILSSFPQFNEVSFYLLHEKEQQEPKAMCPDISSSCCYSAHFTFDKGMFTGIACTNGMIKKNGFI